MRPAAHDDFGPEPADRSIAIGRVDAREMDSCGRDVCGTDLEVTKVVVDTRRVCADVAIAEVLRNATQLEQLNLVACSEGRQVLLITVKVELKIRTGSLGGSVR